MSMDMRKSDRYLFAEGHKCDGGWGWIDSGCNGKSKLLFLSILTIVFAAKSNDVELSGLDVDYLLGSKVSGSKLFDEGVLKNIVDNCMRERSEIGRGGVVFLIFRARMGFDDFLSIEISSRMQIAE
ncbi:hypothetical protein [Burkholderia cepacia]|uniref:hypothetical protein n=1 Tax=Burkholderia cepacia TaxID=292 RepID=UPI00298F5910|nr:hypothetical protein [Burkholderia cepacia]